MQEGPHINTRNIYSPAFCSYCFFYHAKMGNKLANAKGDQNLKPDSGKSAPAPSKSGSTTTAIKSTTESSSPPSPSKVVSASPGDYGLFSNKLTIEDFDLLKVRYNYPTTPYTFFQFP
jgi:hypothetical protein